MKPYNFPYRLASAFRLVRTPTDRIRPKIHVKLLLAYLALLNKLI